MKRAPTPLLIGLLCAGALSAAARPGFGQSAEAVGDVFWVDQFLEATYLGPRISGRAEQKNFDVFEAQIAPHLYFYQNVESVLRAHDDPWQGGGWAFVFVPLFRLRMTNADSAPVRTPSFNPQFLTVQKFFSWGARRIPELNNELRWPQGDQGYAHLLSLQYTVAHHSNGQEGCPFVGTGDEDPQCTAADFSAGAPPLNTRDGNYGTNYETAAVFYKAFRLDQNLRQTRGWGAGVSWERYEATLLARFIPGGLNDDTQPGRDFQRVFGKHRFTVEGEWEEVLVGSPFERLRVRPALTVITAAADMPWRYRVWVDAAAIFRHLGGLGLFARAFYGQDYYNIRLGDVAPMAIVGITWDPRRPLVFHPARSAPATGDVPPPPVGPEPPPPGPPPQGLP